MIEKFDKPSYQKECFFCRTFKNKLNVYCNKNCSFSYNLMFVIQIIMVILFLAIATLLMKQICFHKTLRKQSLDVPLQLFNFYCEHSYRWLTKITDQSKLKNGFSSASFTDVWLNIQYVWYELRVKRYSEHQQISHYSIVLPSFTRFDLTEHKVSFEFSGITFTFKKSNKDSCAKITPWIQHKNTRRE